MIYYEYLIKNIFSLKCFQQTDFEDIVLFHCVRKRTTCVVLLIINPLQSGALYYLSLDKYGEKQYEDWNSPTFLSIVRFNV